MVHKIIEILSTLISYFFSKSKEKKEEQKIVDKQQDVNFQSEVEEVVKKADSDEIDMSQDAIKRMRELLSE